ncbi:MAG: hypothetical protein ISS71_05755 [Phycisphaerae bacterium]|nr:hypothetical protein [Phycisphaerae bacterium]
MEGIYKSLFSGNDLLSEQFVRQLFDLSLPDGPVMIYVNEKREYQATDSTRAPFLHDRPERLLEICNRIDDGDDPCVCVLDGGCVMGTQLATERTHCGYFLIFLPGYTSQTVQVNMDIFELVLAQAQLVCQLIEKNNQLHHLRLAHLSKTSGVLSGLST